MAGGHSTCHWEGVVGKAVTLRNSMGVICGYGYPFNEYPPYQTPICICMGFTLRICVTHSPQIKPTGTQVLINLQVPVGFSSQSRLSCMRNHLPVATSDSHTHSCLPLTHTMTFLMHAGPP